MYNVNFPRKMSSDASLLKKFLKIMNNCWNFSTENFYWHYLQMTLIFHGNTAAQTCPKLAGFSVSGLNFYLLLVLLIHIWNQQNCLVCIWLCIVSVATKVGSFLFDLYPYIACDLEHDGSQDSHGAVVFVIRLIFVNLTYKSPCPKKGQEKRGCFVQFSICVCTLNNNPLLLTQTLDELILIVDTFNLF